MNLAHNANLESWVWGRLREEHFGKWAVPPYVWEASEEQETVEAILGEMQQLCQNDPVDLFLPSRRWYQIIEKLLEVEMKIKWLESFLSAEVIPFSPETNGGDSLFTGHIRDIVSKEMSRTLLDEWFAVRGRTENSVFNNQINPKWFPCLEKMMVTQPWKQRYIPPIYPAWLKYNQLIQDYERNLGNAYKLLIAKYFGI